MLQGEIADALRTATGLHESISMQWSVLITDHLRKRLGTQHVYIPAPSRAARDASIYRDYNGSNAADVCQRHGVSRTSMHRICAEQRALRRSISPVSPLKTESISS